MYQKDPYQDYSITRNIGISIILSLITLGIYALYWQYKQMKILNAWIGRKEHVFWNWFLLSIVTCGIYEVFEEYKMAQSIIWVERKYKLHVHRNLHLTSVLLTLFGLGIITTAIQQHYINKFHAYYLTLISK